MKFTCSVDIKMDQDKVVALWRDPMNLIEWQDGFISAEPLTGVPDKIGTTTRLRYKMGKTNREMELIETVTFNRLPHEFSATYEHEHMDNTMHNYFFALDNGTTRWKSEIHYTKLKTFPVKVMAKLFPSMFKKQVQKWMDQFKNFVEKNSLI